MHYVTLVDNRIVQINFGLKPNFGFNLGLKRYIRGNYGFKLCFKPKLNPNALSLYFLY